MKIFSKFKDMLQQPQEEDTYGEAEEEYVELDTEHHDAKSKIMIRNFTLNDFDDTKPVLDALRAGRTIGLVNIKNLKEKDIVELKRAINKLKKTCDAIDGEIAGFGEDYIVVAPSYVEIYKAKQPQRPAEEKQEFQPASSIEEIEPEA